MGLQGGLGGSGGSLGGLWGILWGSRVIWEGLGGPGGLRKELKWVWGSAGGLGGGFKWVLGGLGKGLCVLEASGGGVRVCIEGSWGGSEGMWEISREFWTSGGSLGRA